MEILVISTVALFYAKFRSLINSAFGNLSTSDVYFLVVTSQVMFLFAVKYI